VKVDVPPLEVPWFKTLCKYTVWEALIIFPALLDPESVVTIPLHTDHYHKVPWIRRIM